MAGNNNPGPANDDALSIGDLLTAVDTLLSDDAEEFAGAAAMLSTDPGEKMLQAMHNIARRLVEPEAVQQICCRAEGAHLCSAMAGTSHSVGTVSLTALGEPFLAEELAGDRRPTFKMLRWHAVDGHSLELMPPSAVREAFLIVLGGSVEVDVDGAGPRSLHAEGGAAALWLGSVEHQPWIPRIRLSADGVAYGVLVLLSEVGVPLVEFAPVRRERRSDADLRVGLVASRSKRDPREYWARLRDCGIVEPPLFVLPRGEAVANWCRALPEAADDPREDFPHSPSVKDGALIPRELPDWQRLRELLETEEWPSLMFRVLELPPIVDGEVRLERHVGIEAVLVWHGEFVLLIRRRSANEKVRMNVDVASRDVEIRRLEVGEGPSGDGDLLVIDSAYFHTLVGRGEGALALHFTGSQIGWSDAWTKYADLEDAGADSEVTGHDAG